MKAKDLPEWTIEEQLTDKESIDAYENALNEMIEKGEILPEEGFVSVARQDIISAREKLEIVK